MQGRWGILAVLTFARTAMGFQFQTVAALSVPLLSQFHLSYAGLGTLVGLYLFPGVVVVPVVRAQVWRQKNCLRRMQWLLAAGAREHKRRLKVFDRYQ
jgi:hypothetical protein